jgi:hypothetical protein
LNITNTPGAVSNLGVGSFTATQFFISPDGSAAYILGKTSAGFLPFVMSFNLGSGVTTDISLAGNALPLSAAVDRTGTFLFVGASDNSVHVVNTGTGLDTQQVPLTFPSESLCIGPGNPVTQVAIANLTVSAAQQSGTSTTFAYSISNGSTPQVGQTLVLSGMGDSGNNGTFTILAVSATNSTSGTVTVSNPAGVTASAQTGTGTVPLSCNPDLLIAVQ